MSETPAEGFQSSGALVGATLAVLAVQGPLPREAIATVLADPETYAPALIGAVERAIAPDATEFDDSVTFFAFHLLAEMGRTEARHAIARLMRLGRDRIEAILGDALTESASSVLLRLHDGDPDWLRDIIEDPKADGFARAEAFLALAALALTGRVDRAWCVGYLEAVPTSLRADDNDHAWVGWVEAVAMLGLDQLTPAVKRIIDEKIAPPGMRFMALDFADFEAMLAEAKSAASIDDVLARFNVRPWTDTVGRLATWYGFSEEYLAKRRAALLGSDDGEDVDPDEITDLSVRLAETEPAVNPFRHIGRNDPCPCGSGKKFKACCLRRV